MHWMLVCAQIRIWDVEMRLRDIARRIPPVARIWRGPDGPPGAPFPWTKEWGWTWSRDSERGSTLLRRDFELFPPLPLPSRDRKSARKYNPSETKNGLLLRLTSPVRLHLAKNSHSADKADGVKTFFRSWKGVEMGFWELWRRWSWLDAFAYVVAWNMVTTARCVIFSLAMRDIHGLLLAGGCAGITLWLSCLLWCICWVFAWTVEWAMVSTLNLVTRLVWPFYLASFKTNFFNWTTSESRSIYSNSECSEHSFCCQIKPTLCNGINSNCKLVNLLKFKIEWSGCLFLNFSFQILMITLVAIQSENCNEFNS